MFTGHNNGFNNSFSTGSAKCPNCAANIFFNEKIGKLVCNSCGGLYEPESLNPSGRIENRDTAIAGEEEENKQEFVCDSCGATVVTDYNTAATFCAFCGSATLIKKRLSKSFRPDLIIPFKVSKEEAIENFKKWAMPYKGIPKEFLAESTLEKITGCYVPFWLLDADCHAEVAGSGVVKNNDKIVQRFIVDRSIDFEVRKVPFDGCQRIPNLLMEAIEPFDYSDLRPYNDMYLPGFYAQRYDKSALDMLDIIKIRFNAYAEGLVEHFVAGEYDEVNVDCKGSYADNFSQKYALFPVWFLNIKYDGDVYSIAVNGQTGEASGNLPIKKSRVHLHAALETVQWVLKYMLVTAVVPALISLPIGLPGVVEIGDFMSWFIFLGMFVILWAVFALAGLIALIPYLKRRFRTRSFMESVTIDKAPSVEQYIDYQGKINMEKRDDFSYLRQACVNKDEEDHGDMTLLVKLLSWIFKE